MGNKYYYAKIGTGNSLADCYLSGDTEIQSPAIPIYFDGSYGNRADFLNSKTAKEQGRNFFECADNSASSFVIVIHKGVVLILKPCGDVQFVTSQLNGTVNDDKTWKGGFVKLLPVKQILKKSISDTPPVLATLTANRYYFSGSFREITDDGCKLAIDILMSRKVTLPEKPDPKNIFICMGSIEIETMIAKMFEEKGCHVPAYRGGSTIGIDIFAHNDSSTVITLGDISILPKTKTSIQVKRGYETQKPNGCDHLISAERDAEGLLNALQTTPKTLEWVKRSLNWLPSDYLRLNGLV